MAVDLIVNLTYYLYFIGYIAMGAAFLFFWSERNSVKEKIPVVISGLIVGIAAVHYFYMRGEFEALLEADPFERYAAIVPIRYIDWILTTPLMVLKFQLLLKRSPMWGVRLMIWDILMIITGLFGELRLQADGFDLLDTERIIWGTVSGIFYFILVFELLRVRGEAKAAGEKVNKTFNILLLFVLIGWGIYPIGYLIPTYFTIAGPALDIVQVIWNIGDAVNKIGFGFATYLLVKGD